MFAELSSVLAHPAARPTVKSVAAETNPTLRKWRKGEKVEANVFRVEADSRTGMRGSLQPCPATPNYDTE
ncbi:hypothetical protein JMUB6875_02010 [Nocardia sp. JMUB6875]